MKLKTRIKLKETFFYILGVIVLAIVLLIAWCFDKLIEISVTVILFYIYRAMFSKQFHCDTMFGCAGVSIVIFTIVSYVAVPFRISILMSVILTYMINLISYYVRDYLDKKLFISKINDKDITLVAINEKYPFLSDLEARIFVAYSSRGRTPISKLADDFGYSERQFYRILKIIKEKIKTLK